MRKKMVNIIVSMTLVIMAIMISQPSSTIFADVTNYTASSGFSTVQGTNQWFYQGYNTSTSSYSNMAWHADAAFPLGGYWRDATQLDCSVTYDQQHDDANCDPNRKWVAPSAGSAHITGNVKKSDLTGGDGVVATIKKNGVTIWGPQSIAYNNGTGYNYDITTNVAASDAIYFVLNKNGNITSDLTRWDPTIALTTVPASNVVTNGSFEAGSGGAATGWSNGTNHARASDKAYDGTYSLKSTATSTSVSSRTVTVAPSTTYKLSAWIYKNNNNGVAYVDMNDIAGEAQVGVSVGAGGGQWVYSEGTWNSGAATSLTIRCVTDSSPTDSIWFDDVELTPVVAGPSWTLNTADTNLTLSETNSGPMITTLKNPTQNFNWTAASTTVPLMSRVDIGATTYTLNWVYASAAVDTTTGTKVTLTYNSTTPALQLKSIWWAKPGVGPVTHTMTIQNNTGSVITVFPQESMDVSVKGSVNPVLWRFNKDAAAPNPTGVHLDTLTAGSNITANTDSKANSAGDNDNIPLVYLDNGGTHGMYVAWEWPHGRINVTASGTSPVTTRIKAGVNTDFKTDIPIGDVFNVPTAYIGTYKGSTDDGANSFKKWQFNYNIPAEMRTNTAEPFVQVNAPNGAPNAAYYPYGAQYEAPLTTYLNSSPTPTSYGIQSITQDYGWWVANHEGDWRADPTNWASGSLAGSGSLMHTKGLKFTLYFLLHDALDNDPNALTSIGPNAHPSWFSNRNINGYGNSVDLGDTAAVSWLQTKLLSVMNTYNVDTFRNDFEPIAYTSAQINRHKYGTDTMYWNARGFYDLLDYMYVNKSGFRYENCNAGGNLKDFATLKRSSVVYQTDIYDALSNRQVFYDSSYAIPSIQLQEPGDINSTWGTGTDKDYAFRSFLLGVPHNSESTAGASGGFTPNTLTFMNKYYNLYNNSIKPLVRDANLYHILPRPDGTNWDGIQYFDPNTTNAIKGAVFLFMPTNAGGNTKNIIFKGLNPATTYTLEFYDRTTQNTTATGAALMSTGLNVTFTGTAKASDIIWIK
ncbi:hypothetical protein EHS13_04815 [Paenibacillus psychroresistens]|uniref:Glycosyl hydrolase family 36 C-terminal domain-containing protein n=1 Tax=Paenibacillus psychroresistens TaxID=1778678 RepID=A0A6B8RFG8_9BACL|nr:alpha-galactosidase [Paenibacillus psychroresistens]QGQ94273.1 hypothetical protein EHS13_04815 [Paenibacillus psychroresistens]